MVSDLTPAIFGSGISDIYRPGDFQAITSPTSHDMTGSEGEKQLTNF